MEVGRTLYVSRRKQWRDWLQKHHATKTEIWLVYPKPHTGKPRIPYNDAVEEAICFGWIDGIVKRIDADRTAQRWTPRRSAKSEFSETNKERARRMIAAGLMTSAGMTKIQARLDEPFEIAPDILAALKSDPIVWKNWRAFPEWYQRVRIGWIRDTRRRGFPELADKRLRYLMAMTRDNKRFGQVK